MSYEKVLRWVRNHPALWGDHGPEKAAQAVRIRDKCKQRLCPLWKARVARIEHQRGQRLLQTYA